MTEIIELKSYRSNKSEENASEEYHEISHEVIIETDDIYPLKETPIKEYDFFTSINTNSSKKPETKKKKSKKKQKPKNVMDLVRAELAAKPLLIQNNITIMDLSKERASYLEQMPRVDRVLKRRAFRKLDAENGLSGHRRIGIAPIFPLVLENRMNKDLNIPTVEYKEPILFDDVISEYNEGDVKKPSKFLDVNLHDIKFKHHHEFSLEKFLCVKATEMYDVYESVKKNLEGASKTIEVNRRTRNKLKEQLLKISPNRQDDVRFDKNVLEYTQLMIDAKLKHRYIIKEKKLIVHQIISLWEDIKMVREKCNPIRNELVIDIVIKDYDQTEYERQWTQLFEIEYTDMIVKIENEYVKNYLEYRETKKDKNATAHVPKPKLEIDYDNIKIQVEEIVNDLMAISKYEIYLKRDDDVVTCDNEKRKISFSHNFTFKVFVDDIFVCESEECSIVGNNYNIELSDSLTIEILPHNSLLSIILFEDMEAVAFYKVQLSDIKKNGDDASFVAQEFAYNKIIEPTSGCIGSGYDIKLIAAKNKVRLKSSNMFKGKLYTSCLVFIKLSWNDKLNNDECESIKSSINVKQMLLRLSNGKEANINVLNELISNLYENCVEDNENILIALKSISKRVINENECFDFNESDPEHSRFKLLHLRNSVGLALNSKRIPLFVSQFSTEQLGYLQNNKSDDVDYYKFRSNDDMNPIDLQRFIGVKFIEKLNANLNSVVNSLLLKKTYKDVVRDFDDLSLRDLMSNTVNLSLGETSKCSKQQVLEEHLLKEQEIHVTVVRAFNLLDRASDDAAGDRSGDDIAGFKIHPLRPLVRVSYHGASAQTTTAMGCHPTWNNTIKLKSRLEPLSSIHVDVYDQCKESLESYTDEKSGQSTVNYRKYNKWLGGIKIPIHTVLDLGNVRGTFKINVPPLVLGYENASPKTQANAVSELMNHIKKDCSLLSLHITTSISYLGGLQTYYQPLPNDSDDDFIIRRLNEFVTEYNNDFPTRNISLTFIDSCRRNKCVTEFMQPLALPDYDYFPIDPRKAESALSKSSGHSKGSSSKSSRRKSMFEAEKGRDSESWKTDENMLTKNIDAAVRYVSLIPTYEVKSYHVVTLTGLELLKVLYGSPIDHAILLASYFLGLGIKCWIIIGLGIQRGQSGYVLVKYCYNKPLMVNEDVKSGGLFTKSIPYIWYIYDASAGERFILREIGCPLRTVSYVFDCDNIWVNVQNSQECESVSFDFTKSSDWQAVFSKPLFFPISISENLYSKPSDVENLRSALETKIKYKIQKWRSHVKTVWNRYCSNLLRETLVQWEYWSFNPMQPRPAFGHRIKQLMASYKIFGFPINASYLNAQLLISRVKSTELHVTDDPGVEFALAVEVYAYPNNVLSVWLFLASVTRL